MRDDPTPLPESILPWHRPLWLRLQGALRQGRLPHALLISGMGGLGKRRLAEGFGQSLLCTAPGPAGVACGACRACRLCRVGNHPDLQRVAPDPTAKSEEIKVDTIRALIEVCGLTAHDGGYRILIIDPADRMSPSAANSLLKTLEEPVGGMVLALITTHPQRLPATIRSRCQQLLLQPPPEAMGLTWLQGQGLGDPEARIVLHLAGGAPLAALAFTDPALLSKRMEAFEGLMGVRLGSADPMRVAEAWGKLEVGLLLHWLMGWMQDLARLHTGHSEPWLSNPDRHSDLLRLSAGLRPLDIQRLLARLFSLQQARGTTINWQLALEAFLVDWSLAPLTGGEPHG